MHELEMRVGLSLLAIKLLAYVLQMLAELQRSLLVLTDLPLLVCVEHLVELALDVGMDVLGPGWDVLEFLI